MYTHYYGFIHVYKKYSFMYPSSIQFSHHAVLEEILDDKSEFYICVDEQSILDKDNYYQALLSHDLVERL